jgi:hypothetical protein
MRAVISRHRRYLLLLLLMPLLTLRALLPAGYMIAAAGDGPRMVLCSAGLAAWSAPADSDPHHPQPTAGGEDCAFAHAAASAPPPHFAPGEWIPAFEAQRIAAVTDRLPPATGPPRAAGARAPPTAFL